MLDGIPHRSRNENTKEKEDRTELLLPQRKPSAGESCDEDGDDDVTAEEEGEGLCMSESAAERGGRPSRAEPLPPLCPLIEEELRLDWREKRS